MLFPSKNKIKNKDLIRRNPIKEISLCDLIEKAILGFDK